MCTNFQERNLTDRHTYRTETILHRFNAGGNIIPSCHIVCQALKHALMNQTMDFHERWWELTNEFHHLHMNFHKTSRKVTILIWTFGILWSFMVFHGSTFHKKISVVKNHETFASCYQRSRIFVKNGPN